MRLRYAQAARAAHRHLVGERSDPLAGARLLQRFDAAEATLRRFPYLGRVGVQSGTREFLVTATPYRFIYRVEETAVVILDIRHSSRRD